MQAAQGCSGAAECKGLEARIGAGQASLRWASPRHMRLPVEEQVEDQFVGAGLD